MNVNSILPKIQQNFTGKEQKPQKLKYQKDTLLENNLKTIGVIASGFDFTYPASNKDLYNYVRKIKYKHLGG